MPLGQKPRLIQKIKIGNRKFLMACAAPAVVAANFQCTTPATKPTASSVFAIVAYAPAAF